MPAGDRDTFGFNESDTSDIFATVDYVYQNLSRQSKDKRRPSTEDGQFPKTVTRCRVSSTTLVNGFYPGFVVQNGVDGTGATWTDGIACYILGANAETLAVQRYLCRPEDTYSNGTPIYLTVVAAGGTSGYSGTDTIVTAVSCSGGTLSVTTKSAVHSNGLLSTFT
jgi:hypothetical protein